MPWNSLFLQTFWCKIYMRLINWIRRASVVLTIVMLVLIVYSPPALAFQPGIHGEITVEAINSTQPIVKGKKLQFSQEAIQQIVDANTKTDNLANQTKPELHFDSEEFLPASKRLIELRKKVITTITTTASGAEARADLGGALHTLQDFYAHSNWVELGQSAINKNLGRKTFSKPGDNIATCPNAPDVLNGEGLKQLTSGYFTLPSGVCNVKTGKCRHGLSYFPYNCPTGLNKDDQSRPGFGKARSLAVKSSKDFLNQIFSDSKVAGNATAIKLLLGIS